MRASHFIKSALASLALSCSATAFSAEIFVDFFAAPGTGFADPTPVAPVGGNPETTLGQQRIAVFLQAASIWGAAIDSDVPIFVAAQFAPLATGVLGSAGPRFIHSNFPGAEIQNTWYFDSLADKLTGADLSPPTYDIQANFSSNFPFYLGFDNQDPPGTADLLAVVLHEFGHGLNFANAVNELDGSIPTVDPAIAFGDIYSQWTRDVTTDKGWNEMTNAERQASAINVRKVVWSGLHANKGVKQVLEPGEPSLRVNSPGGLGPFMFGTAAFGAPLTGSGISGNLVQGEDPADVAGPSPTDGCSPLINTVAGMIVLLDRGTCGFVVKVKNAQNAGAIGVVIADNAAGAPPPGLGGADPTITIPSGRVTLADGNTLKANLASGVNVSLVLDLTILAGIDREERKIMLNSTVPVALGSSISHWDPVASPNLLMEPAINIDLTSNLFPPDDLTEPLLTDLGWFTDRDGVLDGADPCLRSDLQPTVVIGSCNSGAGNDFFPTGCSVSDHLTDCADVHSGRPLLYLACVTKQTVGWVKTRAITPREQIGILACAVKSLKK